VVRGDCLDFVVDSRGGLVGDWTYVNVSVAKGRSVFDKASLHLAFDENFEIPTRSPDAKQDRSRRFVDSSGQNHHGTLVNQKDISKSRAMWVPGVSGNALSFGHDRTYGKLDGGLLAGAEEFTVSAWIAPGIPEKDEKSGVFTISGRDWAGLHLVAGKKGLEAQFRVHFAKGPLKQAQDDRPAQGEKVVHLVRDHSGTAVLPYQWSHLTGTWKSGQFLRLYVNGKLVHEATKPGTVPTGKLDVMQCLVGADFQGMFPKPFNGSIDELAVWPTALSAEQVSVVYAANSGAASDLSVAGMGRLRRESWGNLYAPTIDSLYESPAFLLGTKDVQMMGMGTTGFLTGTKRAERIRGWITAPEDGDYVFWLSLRGEGELALSPDASKFGKQVIISMGGKAGTGKGVQHTHRHPFDKYDAQVSSQVTLKKGERYFLEMTQTMGNLRNSITSIAWQTPSGERQILPGEVCSFYQPDPNDIDDDSLPDDWERKYGLDPNDAGAKDLKSQGERGDGDGDGLPNRMEYLAGTDPANPDTDGDGLSDAEELQTHGTDPLKKDEKRGDLITNLDLTTSGSPAWTMLNGALVSDTFRGDVSWDFTVPERKAYYFDITLRLSGGSSFAPPLPVTVSIDGRPIHFTALSFSSAATKMLRAPGPVIAAGKHRLTLSFDNDRLSRSVGITGVAIFAPIGLDQDGDGTPDWYTALLREGTRVITLPTSSRTSPAFIEGRVNQPYGAVLINQTPANAFGAHGWYADLPLTGDSTPLGITYPDGRTDTYQTRWTITNLLLSQTLTIRAGDSLRFQARDPQNNPIPARFTAGGESRTLAPAEDFIQRYAEAGTQTISTTGPDGILANITIKVVAADLPDIVPVVFKQIRVFSVPASGGSATLTYSGSEGLSVQRLPGDPLSANRLRLLSSAGGPLALAVRLSPGGPILDVAAAPSIIIADAIAQDSTLVFQSGAPQGYIRIRSPLVVLHLPDTVSVEINIFKAGVMFPDGTLQRILRRRDFEPEGLTYLEFLFPRNYGGGFCHYIDIKDADGTPIGHR
jgi:Concanavalin A-like lectin/glucanases superfamily/Bacterial TSP3 repeat